MRFSFEANRSFRRADGSSPGAYGKERYGLPKSRRCLGCSREMEDDGTSLYLRGFCSQKCLENYLSYPAPKY